MVHTVWAIFWMIRMEWKPTSCIFNPFLLINSSRNSRNWLKLSQMEPLLIFLKAIAVSVVVTFHPSITLACLNHLSDWVNVI